MLSVNVGAVREVAWRGRVVHTGIRKHPVRERTVVRGVNLAGDDQADRTVHGGRDKAIYAYAREDYDFWREHEHVDTTPGLFGENLTTEGLDLSTSVIGERWNVGSTVLEVAQIRLPCYKLAVRMSDPYFPKRFLAASRMGAYLRIVQEGDVGAGDPIHISHTPPHGVTLGDMTNVFLHPERASILRTVPGLPEFWRQVAEEV